MARRRHLRGCQWSPRGHHHSRFGAAVVMRAADVFAPPRPTLTSSSSSWLEFGATWFVSFAEALSTQPIATLARKDLAARTLDGVELWSVSFRIFVIMGFSGFLRTILSRPIVIISQNTRAAIVIYDLICTVHGSRYTPCAPFERQVIRREAERIEVAGFVVATVIRDGMKSR